jgi:glycosyltransferase involved in cell wall biosynthesis
MAERKLAFCMVTTFYPPYHFGGDALFVQRLSSALARRGHSVTVVHSVDAYRVLTGDRPYEDLPTEAGVEVVPIEGRLGPLSPLATYLTGRPLLSRSGLRGVLERKRFDVVHFHNISLIGGPGVLRYGEGVKLYTLHEHWLVCPMHVLWRYNREPCEEPHCFRCSLAFHRPPQLWRYTHLLERELDHVDAFLAPSRFVREAHRSRGFARPIRHLPPFLPETATEPIGETTRPERPYFLYAGRLERIKGIHTLLDVFRSYESADLVIAGSGTQERGLRHQAAGNPRVRFLGRVQPTALSVLYAGAIALIVPSVGYEVFPLVSLEAFAQRTPVIARRLGGLSEAVEDSGGGFLYSDERELVEVMETLRADPELRRELGERGHATLRSHWSEEKHIERYLGIVESFRSEQGAAA